MTALEEMTPRVEQYSIDEMFLDLTGIDGCEDFEHFGRRLRAHVLVTTGLTVGVGMGPTKTLAKSAQWASKEWKQFRGVLALTPGNPKRTETLLLNQPVDQIWGVGRRIGKRLNLMGIENALQLARAHPAQIRKNFSVVLERTVRKLNGESCIPFEEMPPAKQQIVSSRSFGERITPHGVSQLNLFDEDQPKKNSEQLMKVLDGINQSGLGNLWFARQGLNNEWKMKRERR